jgi:drug/metabolite transporter (DMT)-like permease
MPGLSGVPERSGDGSSMTSFRDNLRGILAMVAANLTFLLNDTQVKLAGDRLPIGEIVFLRGLFASILIGALVVWFGLHRYVHMLLHGTVVWRTIGEIAATLLFLAALLHMPIADITAILQVIPLMTTAAGAIFLAETVGWRRWTAIAIGFVGVLIVLRPGGAGFGHYGLLALGSMFFITMRDMVTRVMPTGMPTLLVAGLTSVVISITGAGMGLGEDWIVPDATALALLFGAAVFITIGYYTAILAMRFGDVAVVAPFRYTVIVWAIIVGYLVWGDIPDLPMLAGTAIIIATGIYTFYRERSLAMRGGRA